MTPFDLKASLKTMTLIMDTREQDTERREQRLQVCGLPYERQMLDAGDYSCVCHLPNGEKSGPDKTCGYRAKNEFR